MESESQSMGFITPSVPFAERRNIIMELDSQEKKLGKTIKELSNIDKLDVKHVLHHKETDGLRVKYDLCVPQKNVSTINVENEDELFQKKVEEFLIEYSETVEEIERLTCSADGVDYAVAVACGVITGAIDAFLVGEFDFEGSREVIGEKFDNIVKKKAIDIEEKEKVLKINKAIDNAKEKAEKKGQNLSQEKIQEIREKIEKSYKEKLENYDTSMAIKKMEETYGIPSDSAYDAGCGITAKSHHLDDLAHHPTVIGWAASIIMQFTGTATYQNKDGDSLEFPVNKIRIIENVNAYIKYGKTNIVDKVTSKGKTKEVLEVSLLGDSVKSKFACGTVNWIGHLISDMAGSSSSAKKGNTGMGLPGPIVSTLKEFAMLPIIRKMGLPQILNDLFTKDDLICGKYRLDLRSELAIGAELGKQAMPVFLNTIMVRLFFFMRRFVQEAKNASVLNEIQWKKTLPFRNRTIARMLTISTGTMEVVDLADATIHAAVKSAGNSVAFASQFVLRVNFVGVGRFAIASATDVAMGGKKMRYENAMASADVAITVVEEVKMIDEINMIQEKTNKKIENLSNQVNDVYCLIK